VALREKRIPARRKFPALRQKIAADSEIREVGFDGLGFRALDAWLDPSADQVRVVHARKILIAGK
jgi:hypothetical protein